MQPSVSDSTSHPPSRLLDIGPGISLPIDAVTCTIGIFGQKGSGKSSTARVTVEEAARAGAQFAILDPTGVWWGIRSSVDGRGAGVDCVILGGRHADVPLEPTAGRYIARLIVEQGMSVVLDLSVMRRGDRVRFVADFAEEIYHLNRNALTLVIDEAPQFAPTKISDGENGSRCLTAIKDIVELGRARGLGSVLISQRMATLHADVREQAEIIVAHRSMGTNDRTAIAGWLKDSTEGYGTLLAQLPTLPVGRAIVLAPSFDVAGIFGIRPKSTFDSSATPQVGVKFVEPVGRADVDLSVISAAMAETIEKAKADDPATLRQRIADLERRLTEGAEPERWQQLTEDHGRQVEGLVSEAAFWRGEFEAARDAGMGLAHEIADLSSRAAERLRTTFAAEELTPSPAASTSPTPRPVAAEPTPDLMAALEQSLVDARRREGVGAAATSPAPAEGLEGLRAGARRMATVVNSYADVGGLTRHELGVLAQLKHTGGTFGSYLSSLKTGGFVDEDGGVLTVTEQGSLATPGFPPFTPDQVIELAKLRRGARTMLSALMKRRAEGMTRDELAEVAELERTGGTFGSYLSSLKSACVADERDGRVYAGGTLLYRAEER